MELPPCTGAWPWALPLQRGRNEPRPPPGAGRGGTGRGAELLLTQLVVDARGFVTSGGKESQRVFNISWVLLGAGAAVLRICEKCWREIVKVPERRTAARRKGGLPGNDGGPLSHGTVTRPED